MAEGAPPPNCPGENHPDDNYDFSSISITDTEPRTAETLIKLAVKKNKTAVVRSYLLKKEFEDLDHQEDEYFASIPELVGEEAVARDLEQVLEVTDPVLKDIYLKKQNIVDEWGTLDLREKEEYKQIPDIAVLTNGFSGALQMLLARIGDPYALVSVDFSPEIVRNHPVLIIPSGGMHGLKKSDFFKAHLGEYVKQGGTLIVFGPNIGYELSNLPVPSEPDGSFKRIGGYGWSEDQACQANSSYIDTWHQILSGQSRSTPTLNVDGYFTDFPSSTSVILRRTVNGQPTLIMYPYGNGYVIATNMYSDYAFGHGHASSEEIALVRDLISWAKYPAVLPETRPGQTVSLSLSAKNITANDASSVKLSFYNPDRSSLLSEQNLTLPIPAGQSISIPISYSLSPASSLGIYHIDYTLFDSSGNIIQPRAEADDGRFIVLSTPRVGYEGQGITFDILTDKLSYLSGELATFTIRITNHTDIEKTVKAKYEGLVSRQ